MRGYLYRVGRVNFRILNWRSSKNVCAAPAACLSNGESPARTTPNSAYARWPRPELSRSLSVRPYFCLPNGFAASNTGTIANLGIYIGGGYSRKHLFSSKGVTRKVTQCYQMVRRSSRLSRGPVTGGPEQTQNAVVWLGASWHGNLGFYKRD